MTVQPSGALVKMAQAERMLAEVSTVDEAQKVIGLAETARVYAEQMRLGTASMIEPVMLGAQIADLRQFVSEWHSGAAVARAT